MKSAIAPIVKNRPDRTCTTHTVNLEQWQSHVLLFQKTPKDNDP